MIAPFRCAQRFPAVVCRARDLPTPTNAAICRATADLREVHHARYLLQPTALQLVFDTPSATPPALLAAASADAASRLAAGLLAHAPHATLIDRKARGAAVAAACKAWTNGELSNFDYLMTLNTLSGRSHADLSQYPIFPWVLADWSSKTLDLHNPAVFRDLSKPVGALDPVRLEGFVERYRSLADDDEDGIAPFYYGSHYSSASIVLWYLIRLEPFTALARSLQARSDSCVAVWLLG